MLFVFISKISQKVTKSEKKITDIAWENKEHKK